MNASFPDYLKVPAERLGHDSQVQVRIGGDMADIANRMAQTMLAVIEESHAQGRQAALIVPVGPVDQFPILAEAINARKLDCRDLLLINMDEYLTSEDQWVQIDHPLSFRGYMNRKFYDLIDPQLAPSPPNRIFPDPNDPDAIQRRIDEHGGIDACFGGIGVNGHMAFNEPPEPDESMSVDEFAALPTRLLDLSRETRTINSVTVGGELAVIPSRAITVGMREIMESRRLCFYCNRPWQSSVVRRVLHGPITAACPASLMRRHANAELTIANYVADLPEVRLR